MDKVFILGVRKVNLLLNFLIDWHKGVLLVLHRDARVSNMQFCDSKVMTSQGGIIK